MAQGREGRGNLASSALKGQYWKVATVRHIVIHAASTVAKYGAPESPTFANHFLPKNIVDRQLWRSSQPLHQLISDGS